MKYIFIFILLSFSFSALSADGEATGYFGALWDFIDWIYEVFEDIKQTIFDFLGDSAKAIILWYIEWKIFVVDLAWSIAEPIIDSLNLTDVISGLFGSLSNDIKMFITELRIGEAVNLLLSSYLTRTILRITGF